MEAALIEILKDDIFAWGHLDSEVGGPQIRGGDFYSPPEYASWTREDRLDALIPVVVEDEEEEGKIEVIFAFAYVVEGGCKILDKKASEVEIDYKYTYRHFNHEDEEEVESLYETHQALLAYLTKRTCEMLDLEDLDYGDVDHDGDHVLVYFNAKKKEG